MVAAAQRGAEPAPARGANSGEADDAVTVVVAATKLTLAVGVLAAQP